jgi:hypothetical protein
MKSFAQIQKEAQRGDFTAVAKLAGCDRKNVERVVKGERPDNFNIQLIFTQLLAQRTELQRKSKKLKVAA